VSVDTSPPVRYRFGDSARSGLLLGLSARQCVPLIAGVVWLTLWLVVRQPIVGLVGVAAAMVVAFGRWRHAPLYDVALPGVRLVWSRSRHRSVWTPTSVLAAGPGCDDLPAVVAGLELVEQRVDWQSQPVTVAVVRDRPLGTVSLVVGAHGSGFPVASGHDQDGLLVAWGAALAPLARAGCTVCRVTWQEWTRPVGLAGHVEFLAALDRSSGTTAAADYEELLAVQAPVTIGHEILLTVTVDMRRVRTSRGAPPLTTAIAVLTDEARQLTSRLETAGLTVTAPLSPLELSTAVRLRSDPSRAAQLGSLRRSLAAATGRGSLEWGPMAMEADWFQARVDNAVHRTYQVTAWPMLPVPADWLGPLLTEETTRTVTVVLEPVPLARAAADANRQLTSIESDHAQKERHGFRLTARERRRHADVEGRERELAEGHPEFRHAALVTVTAADPDALEEAAGRVEQAAARSLLDVRLLAARQAEGWVASLPLGRSIQPGRR
jgi:hypothetical protein